MDRIRATGVRDATRQSAASRDARAASSATVSWEPVGTSPLKRAQQDHIAQLRSEPAADNTGLPDPLRSGIETLAFDEMEIAHEHFVRSKTEAPLFTR